MDMVIKCKYGYSNMKWQIKYKDWVWIEYLEYANVKNDLLVCKCSCCNRN